LKCTIPGRDRLFHRVSAPSQHQPGRAGKHFAGGK
jgi:hypothetical protein